MKKKRSCRPSINCATINHMIKRKRQFIVAIFQNKEGKFIAECPTIPGCASHGKTEVEALRKIKDALIEFAEAHIEKQREPTFSVKVHQVEISV